MTAIEAAASREDQRESALLWYVRDGQLVVETRNPGEMSFEIPEALFRPTGKGRRGVGTYSIRLFIEDVLKGRVWYTSDSLQGTRFFLSLPIE